MKRPAFRAFGASGVVFPPDAEELIRSELFSVERLEQHAESLAAAQQRHDQSEDRPTARQAAEGQRPGARSTRIEAIEKAVREERAITPAAEWLLDNFYVAQEQIRQIRDDLPRGFYRGLPKLAEGPLEGYPRVFGLAWALVAHTDSRFDRQMLVRFVGAYQRVQPLTIGELWAVAITLRIVLIENLRRSAEQITSGRAACREADALADQAPRRRWASGRAPETALRRFDVDAVADGLRRATPSAPARSGSAGHAGARLVGRTPREPGHDRRRDRSRRSISGRAG